MNLQNKNSRLFNQQVIDSNIDQLIRESPVPKILYDHHLNSTKSSFGVPFSGHSYRMSASAIPAKHVYAGSKGSRFKPPQMINSSFHSSIADTSAADIFISLKNQSMDDTLLESSYRNGTSFKENNPVITNSSNKNIYQHRHLQAHVERNFNHRNDNSWQAGNKRLAYQETYNFNNEEINEDPLGAVSPNGCDKGARQQAQWEVNCNGVGSMRDNSYEETFQDAFSTTEQNEDDNISTISSEVCSLYMWIIKPVPGTHDICVEGKKNLRDENFWHSGVITRRVNEKVVETQTKSLYRLEGNMELLDAMAAGISRKTAEAFWLGFPSDWQQLIYDHFKTAPNISTAEDSESEEEITTLDECSDDQEQDEITVTEIASTDEGEESVPTLHIDESDMNVLKSPRDNTKKGSKKGSKNEKVIDNWIIRPLPNKKGIYVVGVNDSGSLWHSSAIKKRIDKKRLMSYSNSIYRLKGNMDHLLSLNEGLPVEIIEKFKTGFPKEWQELIQEHLHTKKHKKKTSTSKQSTLSTSKKKRLVSSKMNQKQKVSTESKRSKNKTEINTEKKEKAKHVMSEKKSVFSLNKTPTSNGQKGISPLKETYKRTKTFLTPSGESVDLENLGRSRSGRLIKPPLQWWTGQTLELDGENVTVKAPTIASSLYLQEFENGYKKSTRQVKPYWNPRQKHKDYSLNASKSSLNSSVSSVETNANQPQKKVLINASSRTDVNSSLSDEDNDSKLKLEVRVILENNRSKRKKVNKSKSKKLIDNETATDADNPSDMTETTDLETTLTDQELSDPNKNRRSRRKNVKGSDNTSIPVKENKRKIEQVNIVSSSTGDIGQESEVLGEDIGCRSLRSRNVKKPNLDLGSGRKNKGKERALTNTLETVESKDMGVELEKDSKKKRVVSKLDGVETGSFYRKRGKKLQIIEEETDDNQQDKDDPTFEPVNKSGKKRNVIAKHDPAVGRNKSNCTESNKLSKTSKASEYLEVVEEHWSKEEKDRLKDACKKVPPNNPHYWDKVAANVRTKTAEMCKEMYYSDQKPMKSAEKKKKKNVKEKEKVTSLTANVGTFKRRQQLKDLLEQQNENYTDDIFDSTPFRKSRKRKVLAGNDDDAIFEELARKQGKSRFETPVSTENMCSRITVPFASTKKTPVSNINVEMLEGSGDSDAYVHRILKRRLLARGKKKHVTPKSVKKTQSEDISPQLKLFHNYLEENRKEDRENHEDSCHEEDYYWEDEENTDTHVLKTSTR